MSLAIEIEVTDYATPALAAFLEKCDPARLGRIIGQPLATFFRVHLRSNPPNKKGWPSTGFWEEAADSVQYFPQEDGVVLRADKQGLRQRYYGGPIAPVKAKALTIPISPVSYGHKASDFPGLFKIVTKKGAYLVQAGEAVSEKTGRTIKGRRLGGHAVRRLRAGLNFLFKLSGGVNQPANPACVPSEDEFGAVALAAVERAIA